MVQITQTVTVSGTPEITLSFDTRADALLAQTGDSKFIQIGGLLYAYDASGTALTTGDGRTWSPAGDVYAGHFGIVGDAATDYSAQFQVALDYLATKADPETGGVLNVESGEFLAAGVSVPSFVSIRGAGMTATVFRTPSGANAHCIIIPKTSLGVTLTDFGVDGNGNGSQQVGNWDCVHIEDATGEGSGGLYSLDKTSLSGGYAFRHAHIERLYLRGASGHGLYIGPVNYGCFVRACHIVRNNLDGFRCECTDGIFSDLYIGHNGRHGLYVASGANKFSNIKSIWNGREDGTAGGIVNSGGRKNIYVNCETQDNYCDGWILSGQFQAINATSSNDGRKSLAEPELSSEANTGFRFQGTCEGAQFIGVQHSFQGLDLEGNYTTQWPYVIEDSGFAPEVFSFSSDGRYNARPPVYERSILTDSGLGKIAFRSDTGSDVLLDFAPTALDGSGDEIVRFFRTSTGVAATQVDIHSPGTSSIQHRFDAKGNVQLNNQTGKTIFGGFAQMASFTVAGLPSAVGEDGSLVYVSNETGGATVAFSDGTNWRRVQDRAIVS